MSGLGFANPMTQQTLPFAPWGSQLSFTPYGMQQPQGLHQIAQALQSIPQQLQQLQQLLQYIQQQQLQQVQQLLQIIPIQLAQIQQLVQLVPQQIQQQGQPFQQLGQTSGPGLGFSSPWGLGSTVGQPGHLM